MRGELLVVVENIPERSFFGMFHGIVSVGPTARSGGG